MLRHTSLDMVTARLACSPLDCLTAESWEQARGTGYGGTAFYHGLPYVDPVGCHMLHLENVTLPVKLGHLFGRAVGLDQDTQRQVLRLLGSRPRRDAGILDVASKSEWQILAHNTVQMLFRKWSDFKGAITGNNITGENPVFHHNLIGKTIDMTVDGGAPIRSFAYPFVSGTSTNRPISLESKCIPPLLPNDPPTYQYTWTGSDENTPWLDGCLWPFLTGYAALCGEVTELRANQGNYVALYRNFTLDGIAPFVSRLEYDVLNINTAGTSEYKFQMVGWHMVYSFNYEIVPHQLAPGEDAVVLLEDVINCTVTGMAYSIINLNVNDIPESSNPSSPWVAVYESNGAWENIPMVAGGHIRHIDEFEEGDLPQVYFMPARVIAASMIEESHFHHMIGFSSLSGYYSPSSSLNALDNWSRLDTWVPDAVAGRFMPCFDALNIATAYLGDNHVETCNELGDTFAPIDLLKATWHLRTLQGVTLLKTMMDLFTDAVLVYKLGIAPSISSAERLSAVAPLWGERLEKLFSWQTFHGKYICRVEDAVLGDLVVSLRVKIRIRIDSNSFLVSLLPAGSLGFVPALSSYWDLIPLSFVMDRVSRTSAALSLVETNTALLGYELSYAVHSFSIRKFYSDSDLNDFGVCLDSSDPEANLEYRAYGRYIDGLLPIVAPTRLPVIGQVGIPDWLLYGSLLYKFL